MMKLKDKVICLNGGEHNGLEESKIGETYTISDIFTYSNDIYYEFEEVLPGYLYEAQNFELVRKVKIEKILNEKAN